MIEEDKNRQKPANTLRTDQLRNHYHDLNNSWSNTDWAFYMLSEKKIPAVERAQYEEMLSRNLTTLQSIFLLLSPLLEPFEEAPFTDITVLIDQFQTKRSVDSLKQLRRLIDELNLLINSIMRNSPKV